MNVLEAFAGIGGMALGLERAGMMPVGFIEINPWARRVLAKHWPDVPQHDDIRTAIPWWLGKPRPVVDVLAGGYPCPGESLAGRRRGVEDERWLWPDFARLIHAIRPRYVIGENVIGHRTRGLRFVLRDLERLGYTARAGVIEAREMGAPHIRKRIITLAERWGDVPYPDPSRWDARGGERSRSIPAEQLVADAGKRDDFTRLHRWSSEPSMGRVAYGFPGRMDRVAGLGDACVPQVAEHVGRLLFSGAWRNA